MNTLIAIATGGALGAVSRYGLNHFLTQKIVTIFPIGIFTVNILGSLLMGVCLTLFLHLWESSELFKAFLMIGFLGSFTTFSTFSLDILHLLQKQDYSLAFAYLIGSVLLSVGGLCLGFFLTKQMIA